MVDLDNKLTEIIVNHLKNPLSVEIREDNIVSLFTIESLKSAVADSEEVYLDNYEQNRKRKMRISKIINTMLPLYPITDENIKCADEIRATLVNNTLFDNLSNFSALEIDEEKLKYAFEVFSQSTMSLTDLRNQCFKDLFMLRLVWFSNSAHKLLTELPSPLDKESRREFQMQKILLREFINKNLKESLEKIANNAEPIGVYEIENASLTINKQKQQLTYFADACLKEIDTMLSRNGYGKTANSCIENFESAKTTITNFFGIISVAYDKANELSKKNALNVEKEK